jgi:hypothetical protein
LKINLLLGIEKSNLKHSGFAAPILKQPLLLLFFIFFLPRKAGFRAEVCGTQLNKEFKKFFRGRQKAFQENPNGLPACNAPSADFHPPRAGNVSSINKGRIYDRETFESVNRCFRLGVGDQLVYSKVSPPQSGIFNMTHY